VATQNFAPPSGLGSSKDSTNVFAPKASDCANNRVGPPFPLVCTRRRPWVSSPSDPESLNLRSRSILKASETVAPIQGVGITLGFVFFFPFCFFFFVYFFVFFFVFFFFFFFFFFSFFKVFFYFDFFFSVFFFF